VLAVIQRVKEAWVEVGGKRVSGIKNGILVLIGIHKEDNERDIKVLAKKIVFLRIFEDKDGKMNLSLKDINGEMLIVSQFTLLGDCRKGRRPSFDKAAPANKAKGMYEAFVSEIRSYGIPVATGVFGARMSVYLVNDGPVTFILDSRDL